MPFEQVFGSVRPLGQSGEVSEGTSEGRSSETMPATSLMPQSRPALFRTICVATVGQAGEVVACHCLTVSNRSDDVWSACPT